MKNVVFTINGIEVTTRLNDNDELGKEKLSEDTKDLVPGDKDAIVKAVMALPRDPKSTVSQYRVLLENVIVDGKPSKTNLVKLAASLIPDASMKLAVRESHYKNKSGDVKPDSKDSQEFKDAQAEWAKAMQELDYSKYPKLTAFMEVEDPKVTAINALLALGFTKEQAEAAIAAKKEATEVVEK